MTNVPFLFGPGSGELYQIAQVAIITVALILMGVTITAYRNTGIKRLKYVIVAFALFAAEAAVNLIDVAITDIMPDDLRFALVATMLLSTLILLFIGFVKKEEMIKKGRFTIEKKSTDDLKDLK